MSRRGFRLASRRRFWLANRRGLRPVSRRGSYIAEAAVVLPLVMLALITVVLILMFFYEESTAQSQLHMELRQEAAAATGRVPEELAGDSAGAGVDDSTGAGVSGSTSARTGGTAGDSAVLEAKQDGIFKNISGYIYVRMIDGGLLSSIKESRIEGSWHGADGVLYKRLFD